MVGVGGGGGGGGLGAGGRVEIEKLRMPEYQPVHVKRILVPTRGVHTNDMVQFAARIAKTHGADVTALHVIEIPPSLPLDTFFPEKLAVADSVMEQAQAIGREYEIPIQAQVKQSRFAGETIVEMAKEGRYDLVILGATPRAISPGRSSLGTTVEHVVRNAPGRVWVFTGGAAHP